MVAPGRALEATGALAHSRPVVVEKIPAVVIHPYLQAVAGVERRPSGPRRLSCLGNHLPCCGGACRGAFCVRRRCRLTERCRWQTLHRTLPLFAFRPLSSFGTGLLTLPPFGRVRISVFCHEGCSPLLDCRPGVAFAGCAEGTCHELHRGVGEHPVWFLGRVGLTAGASNEKAALVGGPGDQVKAWGDAAGLGFTGSCARPRGRPTHDGRWSARS